MSELIIPNFKDQAEEQYKLISYTKRFSTSLDITEEMIKNINSDLLINYDRELEEEIYPIYRISPSWMDYYSIFVDGVLVCQKTSLPYYQYPNHGVIYNSYLDSNVALYYDTSPSYARYIYYDSLKDWRIQVTTLRVIGGGMEENSMGLRPHLYHGDLHGTYGVDPLPPGEILEIKGNYPDAFYLGEMETLNVPKFFITAKGKFYIKLSDRKIMMKSLYELQEVVDAIPDISLRFTQYSQQLTRHDVGDGTWHFHLGSAYGQIITKNKYKADIPQHQTQMKEIITIKSGIDSKERKI